MKFKKIKGDDLEFI